MKLFLEEAKRVIKANSITANGNEEVANYLASLMQDRGMKVTLQPVTHSIEGYSKRQFNLIGILGDPLVDRKTRKGLLLCSHVDTSDPGLNKSWEKTGGNPFQLVQEDQRLYALGVASGKLDILAQIHAAEKFRERKLKQPIYVVGTCGGEMSLFGARYLIKSLALNPRHVMVSEPTDLKLMVEHKKQWVSRVSLGFQMVERDARGFNRRIQLRTFGRIAHAGLPHRGDNAVVNAIEFLSGAIAHGFDLRFTEISGGSMTNLVPDQAKVEFYLTSHQLEDFKRYFREVVSSESREESFQIEVGGTEATGIRFLPDSIFQVLEDSVAFFRGLSVGSELAAESRTVNLGALKQGPGSLEVIFDLRLPPSDQGEQLEKVILEGIGMIASRHPQFNIRCSRERSAQPFEYSSIPGSGVLLKYAEEALQSSELPVAHYKTMTATEASLFAQAGYETLGIGAGPALGSVHEPNEWAMMDQFLSLSRFYEKLIEKICL